MKTCTVKITKSEAEVLNGLLDGTEEHQVKDGETIDSITGRFSDGCEAEINVVSGGRSEEDEDKFTTYVNPVLFDSDGCEIAIGEADAERIEGRYEWEVDGEEYRLTVKIVED